MGKPVVKERLAQDREEDSRFVEFVGGWVPGCELQVPEPKALLLLVCLYVTRERQDETLIVCLERYSAGDTESGPVGE